MSFNYYAPTKVLFGAGQVKHLSEQILPGKKALIIISSGKSTIANGYLDIVEDQLNRAGVDYAVYNGIQPNPNTHNVTDGAKSAKVNGCDFIIALGGGSVMDAAKAVAAMATNEGDVWDYIGSGTGGRKEFAVDPLPLVCITTTAGTGSEVDEWGVITNEETNEKIGFGGDTRNFPVISIVDPELMRTVPPIFTAYQGFDALFHSTEVYISKFANELGDMYSLTAIENVGKYLVRAVRDGNDIEARTGMALANTLSGYAMVVSCTTAEHSMEHAMSAFHNNLPHGAGLIMISKAFYQFFVDKHVCDDRFILMAQLMGIPNADKPEDFITALVKLQEDCGVADLKMSDYGITPDEFDELARNARETMGGLFEANPCEMSHEECVGIFKKAYR